MQKKADLTNDPLTDEMTRRQSLSDLRVIQIHPSLKCNLYCKHCYSASGPASTTFLDLPDVLSFLEYARTYGFNILSLSGGEPFLYPHLEELLLSSHSLGNRNMAASNGMLFKSDKAKRILQHLDLVAISIDGEPGFHDEVRNLPGAFNKMVEGVDIVSEMGISFGFIHTITEQSWQKLFWLSEFAYSKGAALLQLHPLELTGRALTNFSHLIPSQESLHKVFIISSYLEEKYADKLKIQLDFLHRSFIIQSPQVISFFTPDFEINKTNFSDVVKSLIIDEKGNIYPMSYGFAGHFCIGNINEIKNGKDIIGHFIKEKGNDLYNLISDVFSSIKNETTNDLITWTEMIVKRSHSFKSLKSFTDQLASLPGNN